VTRLACGINIKEVVSFAIPNYKWNESKKCVDAFPMIDYV
jgi:hypothetical protein